MAPHLALTQGGIFSAAPVVLLFLLSISCTGPDWNAEQPLEPYTVSPSNQASVLEPEHEDVPYFKAIAEEQEKQLGLCKDDDVCRDAHFLRGLSALYENRELAALHFRKVVASRPHGLLARESRFWLWFLDVLNTPNSAGLTSHQLMKRLIREVVGKELLIHELSGKLDNASVDGLKTELAAQDTVVKRNKRTTGAAKKIPP